MKKSAAMKETVNGTRRKAGWLLCDIQYAPGVMILQ
jgi:hypothetical protein